MSIMFINLMLKSKLDERTSLREAAERSFERMTGLKKNDGDYFLNKDGETIHLDIKGDSVEDGDYHLGIKTIVELWNNHSYRIKFVSWYKNGSKNDCPMTELPFRMRGVICQSPTTVRK